MRWGRAGSQWCVARRRPVCRQRTIAKGDIPQPSKIYHWHYRVRHVNCEGNVRSFDVSITPEATCVPITESSPTNDPNYSTAFNSMLQLFVSWHCPFMVRCILWYMAWLSKLALLGLLNCGMRDTHKGNTIREYWRAYRVMRHCSCLTGYRRVRTPTTACGTLVIWEMENWLFQVSIMRYGLIGDFGKESWQYGRHCILQTYQLYVRTCNITETKNKKEQLASKLNMDLTIAVYLGIRCILVSLLRVLDLFGLYSVRIWHG